VANKEDLKAQKKHTHQALMLLGHSETEHDEIVAHTEALVSAIREVGIRVELALREKS
jgi:hypothetical protein